MVSAALLLFIFVLLFSSVVYYFCKKLIYKLNKRVLARNLAVIKNGPTLKKYNELDKNEKIEKLVIPFFMVMGYNTFDMREFARVNKDASFAPDFVTKKWDKSKLRKKSLYIKYADFTEDDIDFDSKTLKCKNKPDCDLDELMNPLYFKGEFMVLTNGYLYLFFPKNRVKGSSIYSSLFNLKNYSKYDTALLANFTKQCMFLEVSDVFSDY